MAATTIRVPIDFRNPRFTSMAGAAWWTPVGRTAHDLGRWEMLQSADAKIYGLVAIPKDVNATPAAAIVVALGTNTNAGVARVSLATAAIADGESMNPGALTAEASQDITVPGTALLRRDVRFPTAGALGLTVTADDLLIVEFFHEGAHANDTLTAANLELYEGWLQIDVGT